MAGVVAGEEETTKEVEEVEEAEGETIKSLVHEIGRRLARSRDEIERATQLLDDHWIGTLADWSRLSPDHRKEVGLPLLLSSSLDELVSQRERGGSSSKPALSTGAHPETGATMRVAYCLDLGSSVCCEIEGLMFEFEPSEPLSKLLRHLGQGTRCFADEEQSRQLDPATPVKYALSPGRLLVTAPSQQYLLKPYGSGKAVDEWLASLGMDHHRAAFERSGVDDFLVLPYLRPNILEDIGVASPNDRNSILRAVKRLQDLTESQFVSLWLRYLGLGDYEEPFLRHGVGLRMIEWLTESDFARMGLNPTRTAHFFHATKYYREFSSAEATSVWLRWSGLARYADQFARYQVPFYALPLVNFFIIDEMGVTNQDKDLLSALQSLKFSPSYAVKAMVYWLRDLELDEYALVFSKNLMVDFIESLTILNDHTINRLIGCNAAREKMKIAVREMKEVQFYYSASASLLQDLVLQKYADVFAKHNISIDSLPLIDDAGLLEMGFADETDRSAILAAVKEIKAELPSGALRLFYSNEPNLYQIDHKESVPRSKLERGHTSSIDGHRLEDTRSVEELLSFINGTDSSLTASNRFGVAQSASSAFTRYPLHSFSSGMALSSLAAGPSALSSFSFASPPASLSAVERSCCTPSARAAKKARQRARRKSKAASSPAPPAAAASKSPATRAVVSAADVTSGTLEAKSVGNAGKPPPSQPSAGVKESPAGPEARRAQHPKTHKSSRGAGGDARGGSTPVSGVSTAGPKKTSKIKHKATTPRREEAKVRSSGGGGTAGRPADSSKTKAETPQKKTKRKSDVELVDLVLDPALEEELDREVEEFRQRLESHSAALENVQRRPIPATLCGTLSQFNPQLQLHSLD